MEKYNAETIKVGDVWVHKLTNQPVIVSRIQDRQVSYKRVNGETYESYKTIFVTDYAPKPPAPQVPLSEVLEFIDDFIRPYSSGYVSERACLSRLKADLKQKYGVSE